MKRTTLTIAIGAICAGLSGGALAQDANQNDTDNADQMTQQQDATAQTQPQGTATDSRAQSQPNGDETMDVEVDQEPAEVKVEQDSPNIRVEQSEPDVTVEQPEPNVTIEQPEPNVTVEDAEPNVTVEQGGEPDVNVEQADDAQVDVNSDDDQERQQAAQDNRNDQDDNNSLMSHPVSELEGMAVINQDGEEIGDIQHIAQHNDSGDLFAIISVGGIWGFGATEIALPMDEVEFQDEQLIMNTTYGSDEIEASSEDYVEDNYTQVDSDMTLSEAKQNQNQ
ncbi:PRC-barrel domain-containing protein [Halomonas sp. AOP22-C1-8]|uniref:PRC-barrel domain-containing protein n=1 Tax=Halomonas sp. AOP22-C1-8 TaxID=3457717 RepID=UPI004033996D